jgi:hypothetical protein
MWSKHLLISFGVAALTTPALCAEYYIVQQPGTNRCTISERVPDRGTIVGDGAYGDRGIAESEMRRIAACADASASLEQPRQDSSSPGR